MFITTNIYKGIIKSAWQLSRDPHLFEARTS